MHVAVQPPAQAPDYLALNVELDHMAGRLTKSALADKAGKVDMPADIAGLQVDNSRFASPATYLLVHDTTSSI